MTNATNSAPGLSQKDLGIIDQFKQQAREFWKLYLSMDNNAQFIGAQNPSIQREYAQLMSRGQTIRSSVEKATSVIDGAGSMIDTAQNWFTSTFGLGGVAMVKRALPEQLGLIPLIPIAVIAGSLAAIGKWVNDALVFNRRINEMKRLQGQGLSPTQAASIIDKIMPKGFGANVTGLLLPVALIGALFLVPKFIKKGK